jgi:hypothetical protein
VIHLLTISRSKAYHRCGRACYYRYECGIVPVRDPDALRVGTLVHHGLEAWWSWWQNERCACGVLYDAGTCPGCGSARGSAGGSARPDPSAETPLDAALVSLDTHIQECHDPYHEPDPYERVRLIAMLAGYDVAWTDFARTVTVLGVEVPFRIPLRRPSDGKVAKTWMLAGKMDGLLRLEDGRIAVLEHKTAGDDDVGPGSAYRRRLTVDGQVSQYFDGAEALGFPADLCLYDVLVKPGQKPLKATESPRYKKDGTPYANQRMSDETPDEYMTRVTEAMGADPGAYFQHAEVVRLEGEREIHALNAWHTVRAIEGDRQAGYWTQNSDACFRYGSPCSYWDVCSGVADINDPMRYKVQRDVNPELLGTFSGSGTGSDTGSDTGSGS